ncbi:hypothetical protein HFP57_07270 [Parasphingopyxis algicola]|uniref:hypothetical protein n=1 Tax=Parasphingopyxis algicola TaxID=2026624 RepID=UPI0015A210DD|nr:hypothetical protein HFP57_07270 [Parasphingopyxis algicola]
MRRSILALPVAGAAAAIAAFAIPSMSVAEDEVPRWQQARAVGEPVTCVALSQIRNTRVHDDRTIDFHMTGGRIYRNTLPRECNGLGFEEAFSYQTSLSRLCSTDIITVIRTGGGAISGPSCGLGQFQPVEFPEDE